MGELGTLVTLQRASASGGDHISIAVPGTDDTMRPTGMVATPSARWRSRAKKYPTADVTSKSPPHSDCADARAHGSRT